MGLTLGIVGCGAIGALHAETAVRAGFRVGAAWDMNAERADSFARVHKCDASPSLDALLARPEIDAVAIAVPNAAHASCACAALRAHKHVLLEKPMALSLDECDEILACERASRGRLQIGLVCRSAPSTRAVRALIATGRLGSIHHVKAQVWRRRGIPGLGGWFTTKAISGGGPLIDLGVHVLDLALHLTGQPRVERVLGATYAKFGSPIGSYRYREMWSGPPRLDGTFDVEDSVVALLRCTGGLTIELNVAWAANFPEGVVQDGITLLGSKGGAHFAPLSAKATFAGEDESGPIEEPIIVETVDPWPDAWAAQYGEFARLAREGGASIAPGTEARALQAAILAIYESASESPAGEGGESRPGEGESRPGH